MAAMFQHRTTCQRMRKMSRHRDQYPAGGGGSGGMSHIILIPRDKSRWRTACGTGTDIGKQQFHDAATAIVQFRA
ncbi:hypothetical protein BGC30_09050 [Novacetimonas hansenii]|nr:hypothetical protein BGC30_09050 [Novacetimonas hansenii]